MAVNPVSAYKETSVRTASGGKIIVMLYDEAVKQLDTAADLLKSSSKQLDGARYRKRRDHRHHGLGHPG